MGSCNARAEGSNTRHGTNSRAGDSGAARAFSERHCSESSADDARAPPACERQEQIRQTLQKWDRVTPEQKDRIRATERILEQATPEQREHFQNDIVPNLAQMTPERRQRVLGHWRRLQGMTPAEQQAALNDPRFMPGLTPEEQATVRDLNSIGIPPPQ